MSDLRASDGKSAARGLLDRIEALGNALPDPATLFLVGALLVMGLSQIAVSLDWRVERSISQEVRVPLTSADGIPILDPRADRC